MNGFSGPEEDLCSRNTEMHYNLLKSANSMLIIGVQAAQVFSPVSLRRNRHRTLRRLQGRRVTDTRRGTSLSRDPSPHAVPGRPRDENVGDLPSAALGRASPLATVSHRASRHRGVLTTLNPDFLTRSARPTPLPAPGPRGNRPPSSGSSRAAAAFGAAGRGTSQPLPRGAPALGHASWGSERACCCLTATEKETGKINSYW